MKFVSDPPIPVKIRKMKQRVRWQDPAILGRGIDQTRFVFEEGWADEPEFSFLVIGDSGTGIHHQHNPQRQIAEQMATHRDHCRFVLHTGDVVYLVGSSEFYPDNFIKPYQAFLVGGSQPDQIAYDRMIFQVPILPVLGNHDYYDLPLIYGLLAQTTLPLRRLFWRQLDLDVGWHGSYQGQAYARAFLDCLNRLEANTLEQHLDTYYTAQTDTGRCLSYQPSRFSRLPNRYYQFRCGDIDFFALDSNTFSAPAPIPQTQEGNVRRRQLQERREDVERQRVQILETMAGLNPEIADEAEWLDDLQTKLEQIGEVKNDIDKQLAARRAAEVDTEQLDWLQHKLIESWNNPAVRGRVLYFHHPPYVTEATKWYQAQTHAVRHHLRQVLDAVATVLGPLPPDRPLVDLILNGHAHCLEYIRTVDTGHADANLNWIVCGGSGYSLRRQRQEGPELQEASEDEPVDSAHLVAKSQLFVGRQGRRSQKRRPYSFLRIDVQAGTPPKFVVRPFIAERFQHHWHNYALDPLVL
jgi:hypothetical protein